VATMYPETEPTHGRHGTAPGGSGSCPHRTLVGSRIRLGHESVETTQIYLDADLALKEKVLAKTIPIKGRRGSYRPDDQLLGFLKSL
jgi:hypothetical protein